MDTANDRNTVLVTPSTMALETLLRESKRLQAISEQLIRESRKLRTICMLIHQTYTYQHNHHKKYHLIALIIVEQE